MNLSITGRQFDLTDPIKNYIEKGVGSLEKYNLDIISTRCVISADEKNGKKGFNVEFTINMPNKNTVVINQKDKDVYAAVDIAMDRATKALRRHHDRIKDHKNVRLEEIEAAKIMSDEAAANGETDEIVPTDLELHKPLEIEDALEKLKEGDMQFFVFNDMDGKMRVIYKRKDARFGLY